MTNIHHSIQELKDLIAAKLSIEEILDILGWNIQDLLETIEDEIVVMREEFEEAIC